MTPAEVEALCEHLERTADNSEAPYDLMHESAAALRQLVRERDQALHIASLNLAGAHADEVDVFKVRASTIEECAAVADDWGDASPVAGEIAADIRALKEMPLACDPIFETDRERPAAIRARKEGK